MLPRPTLTMYSLEDRQHVHPTSCFAPLSSEGFPFGATQLRGQAALRRRWEGDSNERERAHESA